MTASWELNQDIIPDIFKEQLGTGTPLLREGWAKDLLRPAQLNTRYMIHRNSIEKKPCYPHASIQPILIALPLGDHYTSCGYDAKNRICTTTVLVGETRCKVNIPQGDVIAGSTHARKVAIRFRWTPNGVEIEFTEVNEQEREFAYRYYTNLKQDYAKYQKWYREYCHHKVYGGQRDH